jgi:hypothetical protein
MSNWSQQAKNNYFWYIQIKFHLYEAFKISFFAIYFQFFRL